MQGIKRGTRNTADLSLTDFLGPHGIEQRYQTKLRNKKRSCYKSVSNWVFGSAVKEPLKGPMINLPPFALFTQGIDLTGAIGPTRFAEDTPSEGALDLSKIQFMAQWLRRKGKQRLRDRNALLRIGPAIDSSLVSQARPTYPKGTRPGNGVPPQLSGPTPARNIVRTSSS